MNKKTAIIGVLIILLLIILFGLQKKSAIEEETITKDTKLQPETEQISGEQAGNTPEITKPQTIKTIDTTNWNSFTHKTYNYTIRFPENWHWDGRDVNTMVISNVAIINYKEPLSENNIKIINKNKVEIVEDETVARVELPLHTVEKSNFVAMFKKEHNHKMNIEAILESFKL